MSDDQMTDQQLGYAAYWKRMSLKMGLSEAGKTLGGIRATDLSAFEQGKEHPLTPEQIRAYIDFQDRKKAEQPVPDDP